MKNRHQLISYLRTSFCALAIAGTALTLPSAVASGPPIPASGGFILCFNYAGPPQHVGDNVIIRFNVTATISGTFVGSFVGTDMWVVHPDGSINIHGSFVFTGSVNGGSSGTLLATYEGIGNAVVGHESLNVALRQGTGGLAGVHANLTAEGDIGAPNPGCALSGMGTYTGQILFAP